MPSTAHSSGPSQRLRTAIRHTSHVCIHAAPLPPAPASRLWAQQGVACRACSVATPKKGCASTSRSPHTAAERASACAQLSNMRMCKCSTATTGANQQNMGVAGPRLQGLYGRPKRGVRPNEPLIAHSSAADERLRKAINHTCWHQPGTANKCRLARSASSQGFS